MDKISFVERIELNELKELVNNMYICPNRAIIEILLNYKKTLKTQIKKEDFSLKQKEYYCNIIENPELLIKDDDDETKDNTFQFGFLNDEEDDNNEDLGYYLKYFNDDDNDEDSQLTKFETPKFKKDDVKKLLNLDFPDYPCIEKHLVNKNFSLLANKLAYY